MKFYSINIIFKFTKIILLKDNFVFQVLNKSIKMDAKEIGFEAFAGLGSAPVTFGSQLTKLGKSVDRVKSQKILQFSSFQIFN